MLKQKTLLERDKEIENLILDKDERDTKIPDTSENMDQIAEAITEIAFELSFMVAPLHWLLKKANFRNRMYQCSCESMEIECPFLTCLRCRLTVELL